MNWNSQNKNEISKLLNLLLNSETPEYLQLICIDHLIWASTERNDEGKKMKYFGQPLWSLKAIKLFKDNYLNKTINNNNGLVHEHAIPKKIIVQEILLLKKATEKDIDTILQKYSQAVIITKEEDDKINKSGFKQKMPYDTISTIVDRYVAAFGFGSSFRIYNLEHYTINNANDMYEIIKNWEAFENKTPLFQPGSL